MAPNLTNPVEYTYLHSSPKPSPTGSTSSSIPHPEPCSSQTFYIAGLLTTVFGLSELPPPCTHVAVLYLLHPRLQTQKCMAPFAAHIIAEWYKYCKNASAPKTSNKNKKGLIAVSFDQRNHGTREISPVANEAWRSGNESHAPDMFSCYAGTAVDTSLLIDYLDSYVFPEGKVKITQNLVLGISLGGHAAWHCVMHDPRIMGAVIVIGCPDYVRLMVDRARLSKRKSYTETNGMGFLGSKDFPGGLVDAVGKVDPVGTVYAALGRGRDAADLFAEGVTEARQNALVPAMTGWFGGKRVLNLSGEADKLVPYKMGEPFLRWLKESTTRGAWFDSRESEFVLEDVVFEGVGHECPPEMVPFMIKFVNQTLDAEDEPATTLEKKEKASRESHI